MKPKKPKRGRPHKNPDEAKSKSILLRLEPREKEVFGDAATIAGIPLTVWIRERLRKVATTELKEVGRDLPFASAPA